MNKILSIAIIILLFSSCSVNSDLMFKTKKDFEYDEPTQLTYEEYKISPNDIITFYLYTNDGFMIIDLQSLGTSGRNNNNINNRVQVKYLIEEDGYVKLPTLRRVKLAGMTIFEAEDFLEKEYSRDYINPFVILRVLNRRAIVSTGAGGKSQVVMLENANVKLIEALALAGGIVDRGRAKEIKVIRTNGDSLQVFKFDLSKMEGIEAADMIIQANDIIYVEPSPQLASEVLKDLVPILTLFTSMVAAYALVVAISQ